MLYIIEIPHQGSPICWTARNHHQFATIMAESNQHRDSAPIDLDPKAWQDFLSHDLSACYVLTAQEANEYLREGLIYGHGAAAAQARLREQLEQHGELRDGRPRYIERQSGDQIDSPTHWVVGVPSTTLSVRLDELDADDVLTEPRAGATPAVLDDGVLYFLDQGIRCECGEITGVRCESFVREPVTIEYMPPHLRGSHKDAGNAGVYPMNGAVRLRLDPDCAESICDTEGGWIQTRHAEGGI